MNNKKLLVLSVGYGKGHHSAAHALAEHYRALGWETQIADVCAMGRPVWFRLTQLFYDFCVRKLPWLWRVTYDLTDTADWSRLVRGQVLRPVLRSLRELLDTYQPELVLCTYPLFAYMLDLLCIQEQRCVPYAMVVTDAREISRPWLCSQTRLVVVPDSGSRRMVMERYALEEANVVAAGFPVRRVFQPDVGIERPTLQNIRILYGAYRQMGGVVDDIRALLASFPQLQLTVLAGGYAQRLSCVFAKFVNEGRLLIIQETSQMADYIKQSHVYIGKAGAATMFECYACHVPMLINYTLPGQEQGNLELLLEEGCGCHVESTAHLIITLRRLLGNEAAGWLELRNAMKLVNRTAATSRIADAVKQKFGI